MPKPLLSSQYRPSSFLIHSSFSSAIEIEVEARSILDFLVSTPHRSDVHHLCYSFWAQANWFFIYFLVKIIQPLCI